MRKVPSLCAFASDNIIAPASSVIRFQEHAEHATDHSTYGKFSGPPSNDNEQAWESLVEC